MVQPFFDGGTVPRLTSGSFPLKLAAAAATSARRTTTTAYHLICRISEQISPHKTKNDINTKWVSFIG
jgi:hypothetical protein